MRSLRSVLVPLLMLGATSVSLPASGSHPAECLDSTNGNVLVTIGGTVAAFAPHCVLIDSGETVTWTNLDTASHNPGDSRDGGGCWSAVHGGSYVGATETFKVEFTWDGSASRIFVRAWDSEGDPVTWTDPVTGGEVTRKACSTAHHYDLDDGTKFVPYICYVHQSMTGGVRIQP